MMLNYITDMSDLLIDYPVETLNGYSVEVISDRVRLIKHGGYNYIALPHLSIYKLRLTNNRNSLCDARVDIDGEFAGTWRIDPFSNIYIERPATINRKFTFVKEISPASSSAGVSINNNNGLIKVTFTPEKQHAPSWETLTCGNCRDKQDLRLSNYDLNRALPLQSKLADFSLSRNESCNQPKSKNNFIQSYDCIQRGKDYRNQGISVGATVLGDRSSQSFTTVRPMLKCDHNNKTIIHVRLVADEKYWKPYVSLKEAKSYVRNNAPPRLNKIPLNRQYDDFFVVNNFHGGFGSWIPEYEQDGFTGGNQWFNQWRNSFNK